MLAIEATQFDFPNATTVTVLIPLTNISCIENAGKEDLPIIKTKDGELWVSTRTWDDLKHNLCLDELE